MNNDRELLELAAKAIGKNVIAHKFCNGFLDSWDGLIDYEDRFMSNPPEWNPITDDGDALRLAVKLRMSVTVFDDAVGIGCKQAPEGLRYVEFPVYEGHQAATRRAIVSAAAEIGKSLP